MLELISILLFSHIIEGNATNANLTGFGSGFAYINQATGGLLWWIFLVGFFVVFTLIQMLREIEPEVAGLISAIIVTMISALGLGVTVGGVALSTSFQPFLFGGIAIVCLLLTAARGASRSY